MRTTNDRNECPRDGRRNEPNDRKFKRDTKKERKLKMRLSKALGNRHLLGRIWSLGIFRWLRPWLWLGPLFPFLSLPVDSQRVLCLCSWCLLLYVCAWFVDIVHSKKQVFAKRNKRTRLKRVCFIVHCHLVWRVSCLLDDLLLGMLQNKDQRQTLSLPASERMTHLFTQ
jgi:hypothetical protein